MSLELCFDKLETCRARLSPCEPCASHHVSGKCGDVKAWSCIWKDLFAILSEVKSFKISTQIQLSLFKSMYSLAKNTN